jgi:hypothetical protein
MAVAAELVGAAAAGFGVTAAKATVDVFVVQYDAYDESLRTRSHQRQAFSTFNAVLSACGSVGKDGGGSKVGGGGGIGSRGAVSGKGGGVSSGSTGGRKGGGRKWL